MSTMPTATEITAAVEGPSRALQAVGFVEAANVKGEDEHGPRRQHAIAMGLQVIQPGVPAQTQHDGGKNRHAGAEGVGDGEDDLFSWQPAGAGNDHLLE